MGCREKSIPLLHYISELVKLRTSCVLDLRDQVWHTWLDELPLAETEWFQMYDPAGEQEELTGDGARILFTFQNPQHDPCPRPPEGLLRWLVSGWENHRREAALEKRLPLVPAHPTQEGEDRKAGSASDETKAVMEAELEGETAGCPTAQAWDLLMEHPEIPEAFSGWLTRRTPWQERQQRIEQSKRLFSELFLQYTNLASSTKAPVELMLGQGVFLLEQVDGVYQHPVYLKRVSLLFHSEENLIQLIDSESSAELYTTFLQRIPTNNQDALNSHLKMLESEEYHPLDEEAARFVRSLANALDPHARTVTWEGAQAMPRLEKTLTLLLRPILFTRKPSASMVEVIDRITQQVEQGAEPPAAIGTILSDPDAQRHSEEPLEEETTSAQAGAGEILFVKEVNEEQLEIARRIQTRDAVVVQGPPGTGKTHTIANLLGHLLAQGKRVLITSEHRKALEVLKEKLPLDLHPLCLSVMSESSADIEASIRDITDRLESANAEVYKAQAEEHRAQRERTLQELEEIQERILGLRSREYERIPFQDEALLPAEMGEFLFSHAHLKGLIPGSVETDAPFPLGEEELGELYHSNGRLSLEDELNLSAPLPENDLLPSPSQYREHLVKKHALEEELHTALVALPEGFDLHRSRWNIPDTKRQEANQVALMALSDAMVKMPVLEKWMRDSVVQINRSDLFRFDWERLMRVISETLLQEEKLRHRGAVQVIDKNPSCNWLLRKAALQGIKAVLQEKGSLSFFARHRHSEWRGTLDTVLINGHRLKTPDECDLALLSAYVTRLAAELGLLWDKLVTPLGLPLPAPDMILWEASRLRERFGQCLQYVNVFREITVQAARCGLDRYAQEVPLPFTEASVARIEDALDTLKASSRAGKAWWAFVRECDRIRFAREELERGRAAPLCKEMLLALENEDPERYAVAHECLRDTQGKTEVYLLRRGLLERMQSAAPGWAEALRHHEGVHGLDTPPQGLHEAWRVEQFSRILEGFYTQDTDALEIQRDVLQKRLMNETEHYAVAAAWAAVLGRIRGSGEINKLLILWQQAMKKIGRGKGKSAGYFRRVARDYLAQCSIAIPAWIIPAYKIPEIISPVVQGFDVVIVDEASQSDVTALPLLFLGEKIIVVGDDEQVSPSAIGVQQESVNALIQQHIQGVIQGAEMFGLTTSLYDIAKSSFLPRTLREHFRCVPDIIGYSNLLSYDGRIIPLRDAHSTPLQPAMISRHVDGVRLGRRNEMEGETIVRLVQACIEQPEYNGKTFGVISLLGDEQAAWINNRLLEKLGTQEYDRRRIQCGNPYHFQGDERDVIFLSMVDSGRANVPLTLLREGAFSATKQRYNVAVSRARDQLWLVHSLDRFKDLQEDDIRFRLIDYAENPKAYAPQLRQTQKETSSPLENSVAAALVRFGYRVTRQYEVGAFRIDLVVHAGDAKIAIECDGGQAQNDRTLERDIQRSCILQRLGWRFIRIRAGEYFRDPDEAMGKVYSLLSEQGFLPEAEAVKPAPDTSLLSRVIVVAGRMAGLPTDSDL